MTAKQTTHSILRQYKQSHGLATWLGTGKKSRYLLVVSARTLLRFQSKKSYEPRARLIWPCSEPPNDITDTSTETSFK